MKKLLYILLCLPIIGFGQNVYIPDANFKAYLVGEPLINTNGDAEIQVSEASSYNGYIICSNLNISNLIGIEAFTALTDLRCSSSNLTTLDVSQNVNITRLRLHNNNLTSIDVSQNTILEFLELNDNQLISLDVSQNTSLIELRCDNNQLTSIDVSNNLALNFLYCSDNLITNLDISSNTFLYSLFCYGNQLINLNVKNGNNFNWLETFEGITFRCANNPSLTCIEVDDVAFSDTNWTVANGYIDPQHYFSNNCTPSAIQEQSTNKQLLKVTDLLGRETKQTNQPLFYIYDDGTVEKRIIIE